MTDIFNNANKIQLLAEKLQNFHCVNRFDSSHEPESWRIANSLYDLKGSFKKILDIHLPALEEANSEERIQDTLLDIGEELRHILYHIKDPEFFSYLQD